jgi:hypothetical protein
MKLKRTPAQPAGTLASEIEANMHAEIVAHSGAGEVAPTKKARPLSRYPMWTGAMTVVRDP